jgi:DNA polymerase III subunit delta
MPRLVHVPVFKPAYLVHGDDHGRIAERRGRLRSLAEAESGTGGVELFEGDASTPQTVAAALSAMTFALGRRFLIVDGVERWKDADVEAALAPALAAIPLETTVAFFAREDARTKAPPPLAKAVKAAGGDVAAEAVLGARELPRWVVSEASKLDITLEGAAARALIGHVGSRQQRLLRELEKLAIEHGAGARIGVEEVDAAAASSAERQVWGLVDALVSRDREAATRAYLELRAQGEALPRLVPLMARRLRDVQSVATRLEAGERPAEVKASLRMGGWAADRRIKEARTADAASLRQALEALSALELASRGQSELAEDTEALLAIGAMSS